MDRQKIYNTLFVTPDNEEGLKVAAEAVKNGEVVAFPTETVYGLGADALNGDAVRKIFEAKGRPGDNPLIVHIWDKSQIDDLVSEITPCAQALIDAFMPGPITVIMRKSDKIPNEVTAGLDTVGIRMPEHPLCNRFLKLCGCPVAAPSANLSGSPSPTTAHHVMNDMDGYIYGIVDGGSCRVGLESTVVDATGEVPVILRPGAVTGAMIDEVLRTRSEYAGALKQGQVPASPGMKYRHYAPGCEVRIITISSGIETIDPYEEKLSDDKKEKLFSLASPFILEAQSILKDNPTARIGIFAGNEVKALADMAGDEILSSHLCFYVYGNACDVEAAAHGLFDGLRLLDRQEVNVILATGFKGDGLEVAYMNRLSKAAGKNGDDVPSKAYNEISEGGGEVPLDFFDSVFTASVLFISDDDRNLGAVLEGLFTQLIRKKGPFCSEESIRIGAELYAESAGLNASEGLTPDVRMCEAYRRVTGESVAHHLSSRMEVYLLDSNDLILTVNDQQVLTLLESYPELKGRVYSLSSYMASKGLVMRGERGEVASLAVNDPAGGDDEAYSHTVAALKAWLEILFPYIIKDLGAMRFC
ncbi:MAG: threonylcarbamoyl-AMP synthase [Clostridiales bacterium]|nr:threonylcarbamoyl-AMP synthase [Clostridiales bacterium]